jgi:tyrosine-protein kinase Etk/Wzc
MEDHDINLRDSIELLIEGRKIILISLLLALLAALVYLLLTPHIYIADALLRVDKSKALLAAPLHSEASQSQIEIDSPRAQREIEILRSRSVLGKVVDDLNLMVKSSPYYFPIIGETLARRHDAHDGIATPWWGFGRWALIVIHIS